MRTVAWTGWVALVAALALTTTNPLYLAVLLLTVVLVAVLAPRSEVGAMGLRFMVLFGLSVLVLSLGMATINGGAGTHVLFEIPSIDAPRNLGGLTLGGPVTGESLLAGGIRGGIILIVVLAFATFSGAVSPHNVLRLAPATLFHAGLVLTIGLTLLPATIEDLRRLREIQALRGRGTGLLSLPGVVVPAVLGGLDRSFRLAEAMEARGYAAIAQPPLWSRLAGMASAPLSLAAAWLWFYYNGHGLLAALLALAGVAGIGLWAWDAARRRTTTRLRDEVESPAVYLLGRGSFLLAVAVLTVSLLGWGELDYNPFAGLPAPAFGAAGVALILAAAWPVPILLASPVASHATALSPDPVQS